MVKLIYTNKTYQFGSMEDMDKHLAKMSEQGWRVLKKYTTQSGHLRVDYFR